MKNVSVYHATWHNTMNRLNAVLSTLEEIRDVAQVSEGVGWYAMTAQNALDKDEATRVDIKDISENQLEFNLEKQD
tara:strand:- start:84 stop:311 length:228 start_codon:yes stop_codon:yes gene_type:complete